MYAADDMELIIGEMVPGGVAPELEVDDILDVLLDNASKYGAPPVEVSVTRDGTEVVMSVRDHGLGLGSRDLKKVGDGSGAARTGRCRAPAWGWRSSAPRRPGSAAAWSPGRRSAAAW